MAIIHSSGTRSEAIHLRQNGKSLRSIAKELNISLSTAQLWTKHVILSEEQKQSIITEHRQKLIIGQKKFNEQNKKQKIQRESEIFEQAKKEIKERRSDSFFIMGLALYWAEGFKKDHSLGFVNSDPVMIQMFFKWLKKYGKLDESNVRLRLHIHEIYRDKTESIQIYWSELLRIPLSQFQAPFYQTSKSKTNFIEPEYKGLLRIRVTSTRELFVKILGWIEGLKSINFCE